MNKAPPRKKRQKKIEASKPSVNYIHYLVHCDVPK